MKKLHLLVNIVLILGLTEIPNPTFANDDVIQSGRYLTISNKPKHDQVDLLTQNIRVHFPQEVQTIKEAMTYLLKFSGYNLIDESMMDKELKITISKSLPMVDRELDSMSMKDGLIVLVGTAYYMVQDPINREVNFHLKKPYKKIYLLNSRK